MRRRSSRRARKSYACARGSFAKKRRSEQKKFRFTLYFYCSNSRSCRLVQDGDMCDNLTSISCSQPQ